MRHQKSGRIQPEIAFTLQKVLTDCKISFFRLQKAPTVNTTENWQEETINNFLNA